MTDRRLRLWQVSDLLRWLLRAKIWWTHHPEAPSDV